MVGLERLRRVSQDTRCSEAAVQQTSTCHTLVKKKKKTEKLSVIRNLSAMCGVRLKTTSSGDWT